MIQKANPRTLFSVSQIIHALSIGAIGIFAYIKTFQDLEYLSWIPLAAIIIIMIMRAIGSLPVLFILTNELFPTEIRTQSIAICDTLSFAMAGINVKLFPELKNALEFYGVFLAFMVGTFIMVFWGALTIPDNRGKSLVKVEETYEQKGTRINNETE